MEVRRVGSGPKREQKAVVNMKKLIEDRRMIVSYIAVGNRSIMAVLGSGENFLLYDYDRRGKLHEIKRAKEDFDTEYKRL